MSVVTYLPPYFTHLTPATIRELVTIHAWTPQRLADHYRVPLETAAHTIGCAQHGDLYRLYVVEQLPAEQVAAQLGIHPRTLYNRLAAAGIPRHRKRGVPPGTRRPGRVLQDVTDAELADAYTTRNLTLQAIADQYGVTDDTVGRRLRRAGVPIRGRGPRPTAGQDTP